MRTTQSMIFCIAVLAMFISASHAATLTRAQLSSVNGHSRYLLGATFWNESVNEAKTVGRRLVTISNQANNDEFDNTFSSWNQTILSNTTPWLSSSDFSQESDFTWVSSELVTNTNWFPPSNSNNGSGDYDPDGAIDIVVTPLPNVVWLFISGLIAILSLTRRKIYSGD